MAKSMIHLNGNLLCAVDTETTGTVPGKHDLIQVCILPLDSELKPLKDINPFYILLKPKRPENADPDAMRVHKIPMSDLVNQGIDPYEAEILFEEWFNKLGLPHNKKISPLAQNWPFDRGFILDWLGVPAFEQFFDRYYRDTMVAALFCNDLADFKVEQTPYPKVNLKYLASQLKVEHDRAHDALGDCVVTAEVYRRMLTRL
jgi:DNA polymerase III epsilon subunit-like protein